MFLSFIRDCKVKAFDGCVPYHRDRLNYILSVHEHAVSGNVKPDRGKIRSQNIIISLPGVKCFDEVQGRNELEKTSAIGKTMNHLGF